jgi:hypothetical protein
MRSNPFSRPTLLAAVELLEVLSQARFNQMVLKLGLEDEVPQDTTLSLAKKCAMLGLAVVRRPHAALDSIDGPMTLGEALVREAAQLADSSSSASPTHARFLRGMARDGFVLTPGSDGNSASVRASLPEQIQLPSTDDEVHHLLVYFGFNTPLGHLEQAIDAHARGDWAACNGQLRTFLESLLDEVAQKLRPEDASKLVTSENRRTLLGNIGFLAVDRNEWASDGKGFIGGLIKMLHTHGSHAGLSDEDHSTFRLHIVLVTAGMLLRRLHRQQ